MRTLLFAVLLSVAGLPAFAAPTYAVLSLMGDMFMIAQYAPSVAGAVQDYRAFVQIGDPVLDQTALLATERALKVIDPQTKPKLLVATDESLYATQGGAAMGTGPQRLLERIHNLLVGTGATHLIVFTKMRDEARLQYENKTVGSGQIEGLGFYIDSSQDVGRPVSQAAKGFIGPFAYFRVALIDLSHGEVVKEQAVRASTTFSAARTPSGDAWDAISSKEKVRVLQELVQLETARVIPLLVRTSAR